jgi:hypothetical protein
MRKRYAKTNPVFVWMVVKEYVKRRAPQLNRLSRFPQGSLTPVEHPEGTRFNGAGGASKEQIGKSKLWEKVRYWLEIIIHLFPQGQKAALLKLPVRVT